MSLKSQNTSNSQSLYYLQDGILIIPDLASFDTLTSMANEDLYREILSLNFTSYSESLINDSLNTIGDEFLSCILNQDRVIQIGDYFYKIDKENNFVFTLSKENKQFYDDFLNENLNNPFILRFSTEDDVFELLNQRVNSGKAISKKCVSSNSISTGWQTYADFTDVSNNLGGGKNKKYKFKVFMKVRYDNWGINRKLFVEFKHKEQAGGTWDQTYVSIAYLAYYKDKNGNEDGYVSNLPSIPPNGTGITGYEYLTKNKEIIIYRATKCLSEYSLRGWSWFRNRETGIPILFPGYCLRIFDGTGISDPC